MTTRPHGRRPATGESRFGSPLSGALSAMDDASGASVRATRREPAARHSLAVRLSTCRSGPHAARKGSDSHERSIWRARSHCERRTARPYSSSSPSTSSSSTPKAALSSLVCGGARAARSGFAAGCGTGCQMCTAISELCSEPSSESPSHPGLSAARSGILRGTRRAHCATALLVALNYLFDGHFRCHTSPPTNKLYEGKVR